MNQDIKKHNKYYLASSKIHGTGVFAGSHLKKDDLIGIGIDYFMNFIPIVTSDLGSWINHSNDQSNIYLDWIDNKWWLRAKVNIKPGQELLMDYNQTPWYIAGPDPKWV